MHHNHQYWDEQRARLNRCWHMTSQSHVRPVPAVITQPLSPTVIREAMSQPPKRETVGQVAILAMRELVARSLIGAGVVGNAVAYAARRTVGKAQLHGWRMRHDENYRQTVDSGLIIGAAILIWFGIVMPWSLAEVQR